MKPSDRWYRRINLILLLCLAVGVALTLWSDYEKRKLNQRYEALIEQREELNQRYDELNQQYDEQIEQGNRLNNEWDILTKRSRDLLNSLIDLRNDLYLQNLDKNANQ